MMTFEILFSLLKFNSEEGKFYWRNSYFSRKAGDRAGYLGFQGNMLIRLNRKIFSEANLVWIWHHHRLPQSRLRYLDGDRLNTRISNLKEHSKFDYAVRRVNCRSTKSGYFGVIFNEQRNVYDSVISFKGQRIRLGTYRCAEEAACVVEAAEIDLYEKDKRDLWWVDLDRLLSYDKKTGAFTWKIDFPRMKKKDTIAGQVTSFGYRIIRINGKSYSASKLAWFYVYRQYPSFSLEHKNGDKLDNSITNLVPISLLGKEQEYLSPLNSSGYKGVSWIPAKDRYAAYLHWEGKRVHLGVYKCAEEAACIVESARMTLSGQGIGNKTNDTTITMFKLAA